MIARRSIQELKFNYPTNVHLQNISLIERQESRDAVKSRRKTCYLVHSRKKRKKGKPTLSTYHSITRTISQAWKIDSIENGFTIVRSGGKYEFRLSLSLSFSLDCVQGHNVASSQRYYDWQTRSRVKNGLLIPSGDGARGVEQTEAQAKSKPEKKWRISRRHSCLYGVEKSWPSINRME